MIKATISGDSWTEIAVPLPRLRGAGQFRIKCPSTVRCGAPRVLLGDIPLAIDVTRRDDNVIQVAAGPLDDGVLHVAVRAVPPITAEAQAITVECENAPPQMIALSLAGEVRFVEGRSGWSVPDEVHYGEIVDARFTLRNDGTVDFEGGRLAIALPAGVVPAFKADLREVDAEGRRLLLLDIASLAVRESVDLQVPVSITDAAIAQLVLRAYVLDASASPIASFDSNAVAVAHRGGSSVVVHLIDGERLRFGDEIRAQVNIIQNGGPASEARLTVEGSYIESIACDLGPLQHGERRTIPLRLRLREVASRELWDDRVFVRLFSDASAQPACHNIEVPCCGKPLLRMKARVSAADESGAHRVDVLLENRGDGVAPAPRLRAERIGDVRAVVDSLLVDGKPHYELDGSVPIFDAGVVLRDIGIGQHRIVSFAIRSPRAMNAELRLSAFSGSVKTESVTPVDLSSGAHRSVGTYDPPASVETFVPDEPKLAAAPVVDTPLSESVREQAASEPVLVYPSEWTSIGREYLDDGIVPLGRHVLALLSWLPTNAQNDETMAAAATRLTDVVRGVQILGQAPLRGGFWGVSGVAIATDDVREASEAFAKACGQSYPSGGQLTALRWLCVQTRVPEHMESWHQAVINALQNADSEEALAELMSFTVLEPAA